MQEEPDNVLMNLYREETFPTLTQDFSLPFEVKDNQFALIIKLIISACFLIFQARLVYMTVITPTDLKFNITLNLIICLVILEILLYHFLKCIRPKVAIIQDNGIFFRVPIYDILNFIMGKMYFIDFKYLYESYYSKIKDRSHFNYYLNLLYIETSLNHINKKHRRLEIEKSENEVKQVVAIARTAMLNYHQKHNITNLPKVQFIQQK